MKTLVVDDERLARKELLRLLEGHPDLEVVGEAANADEALAHARQLEPDLIFLDIQMPGKDGFDFLAELDSVPAVIFTTAYDEHAIRAFEVNALDYLLKPLEADRLAAAVDKALASFGVPAQGRRLGLSDRVFVRDGRRCWFVPLSDVRLLESEGNYTRLYFASERPLIYRSLNYLEERLDPDHFFRADRKHIIGLRWVKSIQSRSGGTLGVELADGHRVEMSRRQARKFRQLKQL